MSQADPEIERGKGHSPLLPERGISRSMDGLTLSLFFVFFWCVQCMEKFPDYYSGMSEDANAQEGDEASPTATAPQHQEEEAENNDNKKGGAPA